jgi:uncharacterized hydrophobic protein (TIGR00271 family)
VLTDGPNGRTDESTDDEAGSWLQARVEPFWVNPATIKGTIALLFGLFIMLWPEATVTIFRYGLAAALILSGGSDLWFNRRDRTRTRTGVVEGLLSIGIGIALIVFPKASFTTLLVLLAGYLALRGITSLYNAWKDRAEVSWVGSTVRGVLNLTVAGVILLLPEALVAGVMFTAAVVAFILGGIMLGYGLQYRDEQDLIDIDASTVSQIINDWANSRDIGDTKRERIGETLFFEEPDRANKLTSWWVMLLLSVAIATFAVLQDSTAVVIGAMLIAPLMTPIMGAAAGMVYGWRMRLVASLGLVAAGVGASIALAFILATWVPALVPLATNSQVTSRVSPTLIDMLIALAAGAAGAYATVDDRVSSSITGVAIAVALVPPLAVVGITLQAGLLDDALGAFLLFLTNFVSILLAGGFVLYLTGFASVKRFVEQRESILLTVGAVAAVAVVIMVPLVFTAEGILSSSGRQNSANDVVDEWLGGTDTLRVFHVGVSGEVVSIGLTGTGELPDVALLEDELSVAFGVPVLVLVEHALTQVTRYSDSEGLTETGQPPPPP